MVSKNILIIDNRDSFTHNLVQLVNEAATVSCRVIPSDDLYRHSLDAFDKILISPGPGLPSEHTYLNKVIKIYSKTKPILGICLGHQAIAEYYGGTLYNLNPVRHGYKQRIQVLDPTDYLFNGIPPVFEAGLYHSWAVNRNDLPASIKITAIDTEGVIMGISHHRDDVRGLQFHPESILTPAGRILIANWLKH